MTPPPKLVVCRITTTNLHTPRGEERVVLEVACPRHRQPVPLKRCLNCAAFRRMESTSAGVPRVFCEPSEAEGAVQETSATSQDTAERVLRPAVLVDGRRRLVEVEEQLLG
ncbi:MAG: hypothetical protein AB2A00_32065, partial [Myxococcota bacterium]